MAFEHQWIDARVAGLHIPEQSCPIQAGADQVLAVGCKKKAGDNIIMAGQRARRLVRRSKVPQPYVKIRPGGCQPMFIRTDCHNGNGKGLAEDHFSACTGYALPERVFGLDGLQTHLARNQMVSFDGQKDTALRIILEQSRLGVCGKLAYLSQQFFFLRQRAFCFGS